MSTYYHITKRRHLDSILGDGLKPSKDTGVHNTYFGLRGNPDFVYLWSREIMKKFKQMMDSNNDYNKEFYDTEESVIFEVNLPEEYKIERDYDQVLLIWREEDKLKDNKEYYREFFRNKLDTDFNEEPTENNLIRLVDSVPDGLWRERQGSYRTRITIRPELLRIINFDDIM